MKLSPTELMKKLKYINCEINELHRIDDEASYVPAEKVKTETGATVMEPIMSSGYSFEDNRSKISKLHQEELKIRRALNEFNNCTRVEGFGFNIAEALVRLAQLKGEVKVITNMVKKGYFEKKYNGDVNVATYDLNNAKEALKHMQQELTKLQVAIDKVNLNSVIEYEA